MSVTLGTQGEAEADHAVRWDAVTVEGIAAPAQDTTSAAQNNLDGM